MCPLRKQDSRGLAALAAALTLAACSQWNVDDRNDPAPAPVAPVTAAAPVTPAAPAAPAAPEPPPSPQIYPLTTYILDKPISPHAEASAKVTFAVTGGAVNATINDFRFQCKREQATTFVICPDADSYTFTGLQSGSTYTLSVQAVSVSTGAIAGADTLSFVQK